MHKGGRVVKTQLVCLVLSVDWTMFIDDSCERAHGYMMNTVLLSPSSQAECVYVEPGNAACVCAEGWTGDGKKCVEINNCQLDSRGGCSPNADCNHIGPGQVSLMITSCCQLNSNWMAVLSPSLISAVCYCVPQSIFTAITSCSSHVAVSRLSLHPFVGVISCCLHDLFNQLLHCSCCGCIVTFVCVCVCRVTVSVKKVTWGMVSCVTSSTPASRRMEAAMTW